VTYYIEVDLCQ